MVIEKVTLKHEVTAFVKADTLDDVINWLDKKTPNDAAVAIRLAGKHVEEDYDENIECEMPLNSDFDIDISSEKNKKLLPYQ